MARNRFEVQLLMIVAITSTAGFFVTKSFAFAVTEDQNDHHQVCLPAGGTYDASFNHLCNEDSLPIGSSRVQPSVLTDITNEFAHRFPGGRAGVCYHRRYSRDHSSDIELFSYASCGPGYIGKECYECLLQAGEFVQDRCRDRVGAQASSEMCCVRYERYDFVTSLKYC